MLIERVPVRALEEQRPDQLAEPIAGSARPPPNASGRPKAGAPVQLYRARPVIRRRLTRTPLCPWLARRSEPAVTGEPAGTALLRACYPAVRGSVPRVRQELAHIAASVGASETETDSVRVAVSEAATNVVMHAYDGTGPGEIHVTAAFHDRTLTLVMADGGAKLVTRRQLHLARRGQLGDQRVEPCPKQVCISVPGLPTLW